MRQSLVFLLLAAPVCARQTSVTPRMDAYLVRGLDALYRMDFDAADRAGREAIAAEPDYPHPYLGLAAVDFIRYAYGSEQSDEAMAESFELKVNQAITVAERWLKAHPEDPDALLALGSGYGISARLALDRHQWLRGWRHGSRAIRYIRAALKADPELYDSYLGLGMFDYYVDTIPRFVGWLAKIMLGGSRARGLAEIRLAAEKGRYAKTAAQLILIEVFAEDDYGARNPPEADRLAREIRARYPDSAMLHAVQIVALYEDRRMDEAVREAREYLARVQDGRYSPVGLSKAHALLGTLLWAAGDKSRALDHFHAGAQAKGLKTRWTVWCRARAGQVLDALGRRAEALNDYRAVAAEPDRWDLRGLIKPCLSRPCVGDKYPGHFSPY